MWFNIYAAALDNILQEFMLWLVYGFLISMIFNRLEGKSIFKGGSMIQEFLEEFCYFQFLVVLFLEGKVVKSLLAQFLHLLQFVRRNQMSG